MAVRSVSTASSDLTTPLPRTWIATGRKPLRIVVGALFLAWSWISTVMCVQWLLEPLTGSDVLGRLAGYAIGVFGALLVSWIEFSTAGREQLTYWGVLLLLDASFTCAASGNTVLTILAGRVELTVTLYWLIWSGALVGGVLAARLGELLLFGQRETEA